MTSKVHWSTGYRACLLETSGVRQATTVPWGPPSLVETANLMVGGGGHLDRTIFVANDINFFVLFYLNEKVKGRSGIRHGWIQARHVVARAWVLLSLCTLWPFCWSFFGSNGGKNVSSRSRLPTFSFKQRHQAALLEASAVVLRLSLIGPI